MPERPTNLDNSWARAYCACSRCGWGLFGHFFSHLSFLFLLPLLRDGPIYLVGCFGLSGPLRQYFRLYRAVSQRGGETGEKGQRRIKMSNQPPPAPTASAIGPCPTIIQIVERPGTGSLLRTIARPDRPTARYRLKYCLKGPLSLKELFNTVEPVRIFSFLKEIGLYNKI